MKTIGWLAVLVAASLPMTAVAQCRAGNTAAGIPVLEQKLRNNGLELPARAPG